MLHAVAGTDTGKRALARHIQEGHHLVTVPTADARDLFLSLAALPGESPAQLFQRLYQFTETQPSLRILRQDVFGVLGGGPADPAYRLNGSEWPMTWVEQGNGQGSPVAGVQVHAVTGLAVKPLKLRGHTVGVCYEDAVARHCLLAGLRPADAQASRGAQTRQVLDAIEEALALAGMSFADVYRTWFFLDDILDWYDEFNVVRNDFFRSRRVYDRLVPASTGVGGRNAAGTALVADLLAVQPRGAGVSLLAVPSPLQCPALEYGSSFSRAVELALPGQRRLFVSGTASIHPDGRTAHVGDPAAQVALTMEVVEAILRSRTLGWEDVTRAIGYFKHMDDAPLFDRWCATRGLPPMPVILAKNDICRDDLLFELELDAVAAG
jgi:enamine deaminase RidA (YjgF/YER057c/UK114 family)